MTRRMREVLERASREPLRRVHKPGPGSPPWPAHPATIAALERHGLLAHDTIRNRHAHRVDLWTVTEEGRAALNPPPRFKHDRPVYLARPSRTGGDYTLNRERAIDELEVMDDKVHWTRPRDPDASSLARSVRRAA